MGSTCNFNSMSLTLFVSTMLLHIHYFFDDLYNGKVMECYHRMFCRIIFLTAPEMLRWLKLFVIFWEENKKYSRHIYIDIGVIRTRKLCKRIYVSVYNVSKNLNTLEFIQVAMPQTFFCTFRYSCWFAPHFLQSCGIMCVYSSISILMMEAAATTKDGHFACMSKLMLRESALKWIKFYFSISLPRHLACVCFFNKTSYDCQFMSFKHDWLSDLSFFFIHHHYSW